MRRGMIAVMVGVLGVGGAAGAAVRQDQTDKYIWLEEAHGAKAMAWVKAENAKTAQRLQSDARFKKLRAQALKIIQSPARLPQPEFRNGMVYNTWQDAKHIHGIYRRTTLSDYQKAHPNWETVLDYDALSKADHEQWFPGGIVSLYPNDRYALVQLSSGGEDAVTCREFDLKKGQFVKGGFVLPKSKQDVAWLDKNTLVLGRDWGPGTMTASGYPYIVKILKRGQPLSAAKEIYRGKSTDVSTSPAVLHDAQGHQLVLIQQGTDFFHSKKLIYSHGVVKPLALPLKADVDGLVDGKLIVTINEDWSPAGSGRKFRQGSVLSLDVEKVLAHPESLKPTVLFAPTATEFAQEVAVTHSRVLLTTLQNVQGRAYAFDPSHGGRRTPLSVPNNLTVSVATADEGSDRFFLSTTGFLNPTALQLGDARTGSLRQIKTLPPQFDALGFAVDQYFATSTDGTRVPYFVVHRKGMKHDGSNPTLMEAYGGFQISETPYYSGVRGKLWLERGGVMVLANIRGGGEFGPAWHEAGLKTHRQRIYDDFAAVGRDLAKRRITSPRRLGIEGGSNGGLLMGVELTQHPELWNAVVIEIPLLDMLRFEQIAAGASWVGEYGSVSVPAEQAFLAKISPYNQLSADKKYPEPLIWTTTKDDRVGPQHARKFAAKMAELRKPYYFFEVIEGGHSAGANQLEQATTEATIFNYLSRKLMD